MFAFSELFFHKRSGQKKIEKKKKNFKMKFLAIVSFDLLWVFVFSLAINYYCLSDSHTHSYTLSIYLCATTTKAKKGVVDSKEQKRKKQK